jgi:hypothetical protein
MTPNEERADQVAMLIATVFAAVMFVAVSGDLLTRLIDALVVYFPVRVILYWLVSLGMSL